MGSSKVDSPVQTALDRHHIAATVIACDPQLTDTAAFCEHYGYSPKESANTIIVASRTEPTKYYRIA